MQCLYYFLYLYVNIFNKIVLVLISFFSIYFSALAGKIEKGYEALKIYNYFEAKRIFTKTIKKDSSISAYGLATIFFRNDNPFHSLDSAYKYVCISERNFNAISSENRTKWLNFGFEYLTILDLRAKVSKEYYQIALKKNSVVGFNEFLKNNGWSQEQFHAVYKRDSLAFESTVKGNTSKGFQFFMDTYPSSDFTRAAQREFELCQFKEMTKSGTLPSYLSFCRDYQTNRHVKDAEDKIFEISVRNNKLEDYSSFIKNHPLNRNVEDAWRKVYQLFMVDYAEDRVQQFQKKYPNYPFPAELEKDIQYAQRKLVPIKQGDLFGFMNYEGETIIPPSYENVGFFNDGLASAVKNGKYGYIDKGNNVVIDFIYDSGSDFEEDRAIIGLNEKIGLIDRAGKIILPIQFEDLGVFSEGLIYGKQDSLYGYYDKTGFLRIDEKYIEAFSFSKGIAKIVVNEHQTFIDAYGTKVVPSIYESIRFFNDSLLVFEVNSKFGICRKNGQIVDSAKYDRIGDLSNDRAIVLKKGMIGYMNSAGKLVLDLKFEEFPNCLEIGKFNGNYSVIRLKGKFGVIDKLGKIIVPTIYVQMSSFSSLIAFSKGKGWGFIDLTNLPVILPQFDFAESFKDGFALVERLSQQGMIDKTGKVTIPISFKEIDRIDDKRVIVSNGTYSGVYNMNGEMIVPVEYEQIRILDKDFLILSKSNEVCYLNLTLNQLIKSKKGNE